jgi:subtilisin-like proprotein convertase family protein
MWVASLVAVLSLAGAGPAEGKQKNTKGDAFFGNRAPGIAIPDDAPPGTASTQVLSTIAVPKRFKGLNVGDLDIVDLQTTGNAGAVNDLTFRLTSPAGVSITISPNANAPSLGPWTIDDDVQTSLCQGGGSCQPDPDAVLGPPFAGRANLLRVETQDTGPLSAFNGTRMRGTWTLAVYDTSSLGETSTFGGWGLRIVPARPVLDRARPKRKTFFRGAFPNAAIPDGPASGKAVPLRSSVIAGKAFKGATVGDVDVMGIATTGSDASAAEDLTFRLTAPGGQAVQLASARGETSVGFWTLDDESPVSVCDSTTPCTDPGESLPRPFAGTSNLINTNSEETGPLSAFDGVPIRGRWTLTVYDGQTGSTSVLNSWALRVTPARAVKAAKVKGAKTPKRFEGQNPGDLAIPPNTGAGVSTPVTSTITVPRNFKGRTVGDLDVTRLTFTGDSGAAAGQLAVRLTAPNGNTAFLFESLGGQSIGPLTIDDEARASVCDLPAGCSDPNQTLLRPFAGSANTLSLPLTEGTGPLSSFDGTPMRGRWTLTIADVVGIANSSTLNIWGLRITPAKR